jgi:hypothetical protein
MRTRWMPCELSLFVYNRGTNMAGPPAHRFAPSAHGRADPQLNDCHLPRHTWLGQLSVTPSLRSGPEPRWACRRLTAAAANERH